MQAKRINKILIPNKPQLDPIVAAYILSQYGEEKFQGAQDAKIIYWERSDNPSLDELRKFDEDGTVLIDVGGGVFDHHIKKDGNQDTATSLVVSYLGIDANPELSALLSYVREDDLEGLHNRFGDLAYVVKAMHKQNIPSNTVIQYTLQIIHILQTGQKEWHCVVKKEFEEKCKVFKVKRFERKVKIGVIESDNLQVGNYGLTVENFGVIIQKRSSGNVLILTNKFLHIDLREIIAAIRKKELELSGYNKPVDLERLKFEGKNALIPNWFFHRSLNAFLNGSDALCRTEPTKIPFNEIIDFVKGGIEK